MKIYKLLNFFIFLIFNIFSLVSCNNNTECVITIKQCYIFYEYEEINENNIISYNEQSMYFYDIKEYEETYSYTVSYNTKFSSDLFNELADAANTKLDVYINYSIHSGGKYTIYGFYFDYYMNNKINDDYIIKSDITLLYGWR